MKLSNYPIGISGLVFREIFNDVSSIVNNGGDIKSDVTIEKGYAYFKGNLDSRIKYDFDKLPTDNSNYERITSTDYLYTEGKSLLFVIRYDKGTVDFFKNGELKETHTSTITSIGGIQTKNTRIGMRPNSSYPYKGFISNIRIYNRVLSNEEINQIYTSERIYYG